MELKIVEDDLTGVEIHALLTTHLDFMRAVSPPESVHALDLDALRAPEVTFWTAWDGEELLGCAALKQLDNDHGEIKSMHTALQSRGKGIAAIMLEHVVTNARRSGLSRLSLETGSTKDFAPAHALYARHGFTDCAPFGDYQKDPFSRYMTLQL